jgi:hypothetical protein
VRRDRHGVAVRTEKALRRDVSGLSDVDIAIARMLFDSGTGAVTYE